MKHVKIFNFKFELPFSADEIWKLLANDYGSVANYSNGLTSSGLIASNASNDQHMQRICRLDEKDKSYLIEQMTDVNVDQKKFTNLIVEVKKLPIVPKLSKTIFHLIPIDAHKCQFNMEVHFRTKPAFLARFMKKVSQKQMGDMVIGIEHYLKTGEIVTKANFKKVSKLYKLVEI